MRPESRSSTPGEGCVISARTASPRSTRSGRSPAATVGIDGGLSGDGLGVAGSRDRSGGTSGPLIRPRCKPRRKSLPSLRQFRAIAENCSRCQRMVSRDPMVNGRWTRIQAPDGEVSSSVAGARKDVPLSSSQVTSATAHMVLRGSIVRPSMSTVSAPGNRSLMLSRDRRISRRGASIRWPQGLEKEIAGLSYRQHASALRPQGIRCAPRLPSWRAIPLQSSPRQGTRSAMQ
jgi:hypothetical protein